MAMAASHQDDDLGQQESFVEMANQLHDRLKNVSNLLKISLEDLQTAQLTQTQINEHIHNIRQKFHGPLMANKLPINQMAKSPPTLDE